MNGFQRVTLSQFRLRGRVLRIKDEDVNRDPRTRGLNGNIKWSFTVDVVVGVGDRKWRSRRSNLHSRIKVLLCPETRVLRGQSHLSVPTPGPSSLYVVPSRLPQSRTSSSVRPSVPPEGPIFVDPSRTSSDTLVPSRHSPHGHSTARGKPFAPSTLRVPSKT